MLRKSSPLGLSLYTLGVAFQKLQLSRAAAQNYQAGPWFRSVRVGRHAEPAHAVPRFRPQLRLVDVVHRVSCENVHDNRSCCTVKWCVSGPTHTHCHGPYYFRFQHWNRSLQSMLLYFAACRKKKAVHKTTSTDDKRLQNTLKRLGVNTIPSIEEVNIFMDTEVIHFVNPKGVPPRAYQRSIEDISDVLCLLYQ